VATFSVACEELDCTFDASLSEDPDGSIETYEWDFGDGTLATGPTASHLFDDDGSVVVALTVTDDRGTSITTRRSVRLSGAENLTPTAAFTWECVELECTFDAGTSLDPDGTIITYRWDFGDGGRAIGANSDHRYSSSGAYPVVLTVLDDELASDVDAQTVTATSEPGSGIVATTTSSTTTTTTEAPAAAAPPSGGDGISWLPLLLGGGALLLVAGGGVAIAKLRPSAGPAASASGTLAAARRRDERDRGSARGTRGRRAGAVLGRSSKDVRKPKTPSPSLRQRAAIKKSVPDARPAKPPRARRGTSGGGFKRWFRDSALGEALSGRAESRRVRDKIKKRRGTSSSRGEKPLP
jgi:chitodextrinase